MNLCSSIVILNSGIIGQSVTKKVRTISILKILSKYDVIIKCYTIMMYSYQDNARVSNTYTSRNVHVYFFIDKILGIDVGLCLKLV